MLFLEIGPTRSGNPEQDDVGYMITKGKLEQVICANSDPYGRQWFLLQDVSPPRIGASQFYTKYTSKSYVIAMEHNFFGHFRFEWNL